MLHNQSPLPFFSLLEDKAFKHFLKGHSEEFISALEKIVLSLTKISKKVPELLSKIIMARRDELSKTKTTKEVTLTKA